MEILSLYDRVINLEERVEELERELKEKFGALHSKKLGTAGNEFEPLLGQSIENLGLSVRASKCLDQMRVVLLGDLVRWSADELLEVRNFGMTTLNEIRDKLQNYGLKLRDD